MPEIASPEDEWDWDDENQMWVSKGFLNSPGRAVREAPPPDKKFHPCIVPGCIRSYYGERTGGHCFDHDAAEVERRQALERLMAASDRILADVFGA